MTATLTGPVRGFPHTVGMVPGWCWIGLDAACSEVWLGLVVALAGLVTGPVMVTSALEPSDVLDSHFNSKVLARESAVGPDVVVNPGAVLWVQAISGSFLCVVGVRGTTLYMLAKNLCLFAWHGPWHWLQCKAMYMTLLMDARLPPC